MPLLNPFLRAFFRSHFISQCSPVQDHILLVPVTEILTNTRDRETGALYSDLAGQDEFMGSHVLRIPSGALATPSTEVGGRENRGKVRQFTTINGRTVVIKDSWVYSNKGFRSLNQAQLLNDIIYYPDVIEPQQWLIYFISRPLIGSLEHVTPIPAQIKPPRPENAAPKTTSSNSKSSTHSSSSKKKGINSFGELLMLYPIIARQMQPGFEEIIYAFGKSFEKPLPPSPPRSISPSVASTSAESSASKSDGPTVGVSFAEEHYNRHEPRTIKTVEDEQSIRRALEIAVSSAIDLFQRVDQAQISLLASSTDLTGIAVERLIERYITEQLHDNFLFPRVCSTKRKEDEELNQKIKAMEFVDLTQVGIPTLEPMAMAGLVKRLTKGIELFKKISSAKTPHAMTDILLNTAQSLTKVDDPVDQIDDVTASHSEKEKEKEKASEGHSTIVTMNADMLVSLLLIIVIRAKVPHLTACLSYMRNYVFVDDVEQGETGYILSTLEAVLYHIVQDSDQLSLASNKNKELWKNIKKGNVDGIRKFLDPYYGQEEAIDSDETSLNTTSDIGVTRRLSAPEISDSSDEDEYETGVPPIPTTALDPLITGSIDTVDAEGIDEDDQYTQKAESVGSLDNLSGEEQLPVENGSEPSSVQVNSILDDNEAFGSKELTQTDAPNLSSEEFSPNASHDKVDGVDKTVERDTSPSVAPEGSDIRTNGKLSNGAPKGKENESSTHVPRRFPGLPESTSATSLSLTVQDALSTSRLSRTQTMTSYNTMTSQLAELSSHEKLSKIRNSNGDSLLMMAIQDKRPRVFDYLIHNPNFPLQFVLDDDNYDGTSLISAAIQLETIEIVDILLNELMNLPEDEIKKYLNRVDTAGRGAGHYLFHSPDLIQRVGKWVLWTQKDKNGQTPLFALCRSYDHSRYREMVQLGINAAQRAQGDGEQLHLNEHVDKKGNTLLHIVGDPTLLRILLRCDAEVNATNERGFTPLMVASKYGRIDSVRTLFADPRVDLQARELRGMTAVELAKDDEVRNRIDDLVLFQNPPNDDGRVTAVVRSFFGGEGATRFVLKSGAPSSQQTLTITTCRRSFDDFEFLGEWLAYENPASWLPVLPDTRSPYQIPSKPSRAVLRDMQLRADFFLRSLLLHSTFSTHEMLWEFFLVPELQSEQLIERSKRKAELREEHIREEYRPIDDVREVEMFMAHAKEAVRSITYAFRSIIRRSSSIRSCMMDFSDAHNLAASAMGTLQFLTKPMNPHHAALTAFSATLVPSDTSPHCRFIDDMRDVHNALNGVLIALDRPKELIIEMQAAQKQVDKHMQALRRSDRWPLAMGLLDDTRARIHTEAKDNARKAADLRDMKSAELRYTHSVAASELAAFHELRETLVRRAARTLAQRTVVAEKARLEAMLRAVRGVVNVSRRSSSSSSGPSRISEVMED